MSDTTLISIRIPNDLLAEVQLLAERERRSRAQIILMRLSDGLLRSGEAGGVSDRVQKAVGDGGGYGTSVSVVPKAKGEAKRLHSLQPMRDELAGRRASFEGLPEPKPGGGKIGCPHGCYSIEVCRKVGGGC